MFAAHTACPFNTNGEPLSEHTHRGSCTVVLAGTQVWGYAKVWVLGRFWLRLRARFGGAADPGFAPRRPGLAVSARALKIPPWVHFFI